MASSSAAEESTPALDAPSPYSVPTIQVPQISHSIRDKWVWRKLVSLGIRVFQRDKTVISGVLPLPFKLCVKYGPTVQLSEATTLKFVADSTSIPIPKVYCAFQKRNSKYIVMRRIKGEEIGNGWAERSEAERESLLQQLRSHFEELRKIPHPQPGTIAGTLMQPLYDPRTYKGDYGFGPFANERDFNMFLRFGMEKYDGMLTDSGSDFTEEERAEFCKLIEGQDKEHHEICFTHGDASSSNILVKDGKIAALIDFEMSGFYPEYWEYANAMNVNRFDGFWKDEIGKFLKEYPRELEMESIRRKHFGPYGFRGCHPWN